MDIRLSEVSDAELDSVVFQELLVGATGALASLVRVLQQHLIGAALFQGRGERRQRQGLRGMRIHRPAHDSADCTGPESRPSTTRLLG